ncbi:MAG: hypothetical protein ABFC84_03815 [Veillonellales bacterium]
MSQADGTVITVPGTTTLIAGGNDITLSQAGNNFGTVAVTSGKDVTLTDTDGIDLGASNVTGDLTVTVAAGNITNSGPLKVTNASSTASFAANGSSSSISINNSSNEFDGSLSIAGNHLQNVSIVDTTPLELPAITVAHDLYVSALGVTQNGALVVGGTTDVEAGAGAINLGNDGNSFTGAVTLGNSGTTNDIILTNATTTELAGVTAGHNLTVTSGGDISQSGAIDAANGTTTLTAGTTNSPADITLNNDTNNFKTVTINRGANVSLKDDNDIDLGPSTVSGTLNVATLNNGNITQSGKLDVTGAADINAGSGNIILAEDTNDFKNSVAVTGKNVTVHDANDIRLGTSNVTGDLTITAVNGAISQSGTLVSVGQDAAYTASGTTGSVTLGSQTIGRNLTITAEQTIGQTTGTAIDAHSGTTILTAGTTSSPQDITLNNDTNDFKTVTINRGANVSLKDASDIQLGTSNVSGNLTVTAAAGAITQSGAIDAHNGTTTLTAGTTSSPQDITLNNDTNDFKTVTINRGANVSLKDANDIQLGTSNVSGNLTVTVAAGAITQSGAIDAHNGTTTLTAGTEAVPANITLDNAGNDFGTVSVVHGSTVSLKDKNGIDLGASTVSGDLTVTAANGAISQSGTLVSVGQDAAYSASGATGTITLGSQTIGRNLTITADQTIGQTTGTAIDDHSGTTTLTAGTLSTPANITMDNDANNFKTVIINRGENVSLKDDNDIDLGPSTVSGTLGVATLNNGSITQSGKLDVTGAAEINAGGGNITLADDTNDFKNSVALIGKTVTVHDANDIRLGTSNVSGNLTITAVNGAISQSGAIDAHSGTITLTAGTTNSPADITLNNDTNNFKTVIISQGKNVSLKDNNDIDLGQSTVSGTLGVATLGNGNITQSGKLDVTGAATINAGSGNITLADDTNDFKDGLTLTGGTIDVHDANALKLGTTQATVLNITAHGDVTQAGVLTVTDTTNISAGAGVISLGNSGNSFTGAVTLTNSGTNDISLTNTKATKLAGVTAGQNLTVTSGGDISQSGAIDAHSGTTTLTAGTVGNEKEITLQDTGNNFGSLGATGSAVSINDTNGITLDDITAGSLNLTAHGAVSQTGVGNKVIVTGATAVDANGSIITLNNADNDFGSFGAKGSAVTVNDASGITLDDITASSLNLTAHGAVSQTGTGNKVIVTGATAVTAQSTDSDGHPVAQVITLSNSDNDFGSFGATGSAVTVNDKNGIILDNINGSSLTLTAGGNVSQVSGQTITATNLAVSAGGNVNLKEANTIGTAAVEAAGHDVTLRDDGGFSLGSVVRSNGTTLKGIEAKNVHLISSGTVNGNAPITASGLALTGTGGDFELGTQNNTISILAARTGSVILNNTGAVKIGTVTANGVTTVGVTTSGTFSLTAGGDITQDQAIETDGTATLDAGTHDIVLNSGSNDFKDSITAAGANVTLADANDMELGNISATGLLDLTAGGGISQTAGKTISATNLAARAGGSVNLKEANTIGTAAVDASGHDITLRDDGGFAIGEVTRTDGTVLNGINAGSGSVQLITTGTVTESQPITARGLELTGDGGTFDLEQPNNIGTLAADTGSITLKNSGAIDIGSVAANGVETDGVKTSGTFSLTAGGNITQDQAIETDGTATFDAGTGDIQLDEANKFGGTVNAAGNDITLHDADSIDVGTVTAGGNLSVEAGNGDIIDSGAITVADNAQFSATGGMSQTTGSLTIEGTTDIEAGAGAIDLGSSSNTFTGTVTLANSGTNDINLTNTTATTLGEVTAGQNLVVTSGGAVSQADNTTITVPGTTTITAGTTGSPADITLDKANDFVGSITAAGSNVTLHDVSTNGMELGNINASGGLVDLTADNGISQTAGTSMDAAELAASAGGNVNLKEANTIGTAAVAAAGHEITVRDDGGFTIGDVQRTEGTTLSGINAGTTGSVQLITGDAGTVTQTQPITAGGLELTGAGGTFDLEQPNNIGTLAADTGSITLRNSGAIDVGSVTANGVTTDGVTTTGTFSLTADGDITQTKAISTTGAAAINAGGGNITLADDANDYKDSVALTGGNVTVHDANDIRLETSNVSGDLTVTAVAGAISQSGAIDAHNGTTTLTAGTMSSPQNITLNNDNNDFGTVVISNSSNAAIKDQNGITLGSSNVTNLLDLTAGGNVSQVPGQTISAGNLAVSADGNVNLNEANTIGTAAITAAGHDITLRDDGGFALGEVTRTDGTVLSGINAGSGSVNLISSGTVAGNAPITAGGLDLTGNGGDFELGTQSNTISTLAANTGSIVLNNTGAVNIGMVTANGVTTVGVTTSGTFRLTAGGNITQDQAIVAKGAATFNAGDNAITLTNGDNDFNSLGAAGNTVTVNDKNGITLNDITAGSLTLTAHGDVSQTTPANSIVVTGNTTVDANGGSINLGNTVNDFNTVSLNGSPLVLRDSNGYIMTSINGASASGEHDAVSDADNRAGEPDVPTTTAENNPSQIGQAPASPVTIIKGEGTTAGTTQPVSPKPSQSSAGQGGTGLQGDGQQQGIGQQAAGSPSGSDQATGQQGSNDQQGDGQQDPTDADQEESGQETAPGGSLILTGSKGVSENYTINSSGDSMTVSAAAANSSPSAAQESQTNEIPVYRMENQERQTYGAYAVSSDGQQITLVPSSLKSEPTANVKAECKTAYATVSLDSGATGVYNVGFNGTTLLVYPLDEGAKKLIQETDDVKNKPIVAVSLLTAMHDMGLSLAQIKAVYIYTN